MTRFSQSGVMEDFQLVGEAPARISMMQQDNYPVKMGVDPDLGCTVSTDAVYSADMLFPLVITLLTSQLSSLPQGKHLLMTPPLPLPFSPDCSDPDAG